MDSRTAPAVGQGPDRRRRAARLLRGVLRGATRCPCVLRPLFEASAGRVVNGVGRVGRKSVPPAGVVRIRGRSLMAPVAIGSIIRSHEQSCNSARALPSQHETDREFDVLHRRFARGAGLDEPAPGVAHAPSAVSPPATMASSHRSSVTAGKMARRLRSRNVTYAPHGELLPGEAGVDRLFEHRCRERAARRPVDAVRLGGGVVAPAATGGQCTAVAGGPVLDVDVGRVDVDGLQCALPAASGVPSFPRHRPPSSKLRT